MGTPEEFAQTLTSKVQELIAGGMAAKDAVEAVNGALFDDAMTHGRSNWPEVKLSGDGNLIIHMADER